MKHYQLREKVIIYNNFLVAKIFQGVYGLPQAVILSNKHLIKHPSKYNYVPSKHKTGLFTRPTQPVTFVLTINYFDVNYVGKEHSGHLVKSVQDL